MMVKYFSSFLYSSNTEIEPKYYKENANKIKQLTFHKALVLTHGFINFPYNFLRNYGKVTNTAAHADA